MDVTVCVVRGMDVTLEVDVTVVGAQGKCMRGCCARDACALFPSMMDGTVDAVRGKCRSGCCARDGCDCVSGSRDGCNFEGWM